MKDNPIILHLETAGKVCSVAISQGLNIVAKKELHAEHYTHSENLHAFASETLTQASIPWDALSAISISHGPGSYTGLRIGVSAAKGFCYALNIPLISACTLRGMAKQFMLQNPDITSGKLKPMLDARRLEVFTATYNTHLKEVTPVHAEVIDPKIYHVKDKEYWMGDGAEKFNHILAPDSNVQIIEGIYPSAQNHVPEVLGKFQKQQFEDVAYFTPFYLKDFVATTAKKQI